MHPGGAKTIRRVFPVSGNSPLMKKELDWDHLRIFLAAARSGSFRRAADKLGVNHGTVHRAISALEADLGTRLFVRTTSGLELTQPGEELAGPAEEMETQVSTVARRVSGLDLRPSGTIRLSLPMAFSHSVLSDMLRLFSADYPDITVHVIATNRVSDLSRLEADVSLRVAYQVDEDVFGRKLLNMAQAIYASPSYLRQHPGLAETKGDGAHWIVWNDHCDWIADSPFPNAGVRHILPEVSMQIEAAAQGLGLIKVPAFAADADTRLTRVPGVTLSVGPGLWLLYHGDLRRVARVRAFVDFALAYFERNKARFTT